MNIYHKQMNNRHLVLVPRLAGGAKGPIKLRRRVPYGALGGAGRDVPTCHGGPKSGGTAEQPPDFSIFFFVSRQQ